MTSKSEGARASQDALDKVWTWLGAFSNARRAEPDEGDEWAVVAEHRGLNFVAARPRGMRGITVRMTTGFVPAHRHVLARLDEPHLERVLANLRRAAFGYDALDYSENVAPGEVHMGFSFERRLMDDGGLTEHNFHDAVTRLTAATGQLQYIASDLLGDPRGGGEARR